jgi:deoxycytidylate deaminase
MNVGILKHTIEEANKSTYYPYKIGATIYKGKRIYSSGHNAIRSNRIHSKYKNFAQAYHAEQAAFINYKGNWNNLSGANILIIRINQSGNINLAKPCQMCYHLIQFVGIKWIYYSNHHGEIVREKVKEIT